MLQKKIVAIVNGYGVPKDIFSDLSYHAYLVQVFNYLFDRYRKFELTIVCCGGHTSFFPPYRRTEGAEMSRWFKDRIRKLKLVHSWEVRQETNGLTAVENLLACRKFVKVGRILCFCEKTRETKMRHLAHKIFRKRVMVFGVEFDGSPPRYQSNRQVMEREDLQYSLLALKNSEWRNVLHAAAEEKIRVLRRMPARIRVTEINRITRRIRQEYVQRLKSAEYRIGRNFLRIYRQISE